MHTCMHVQTGVNSLAIRLRGTLLSSWFIPRYIRVCVYMMSHTHICHQTKTKHTDLHTHIHIHIHTGMRVTKAKVEHMEDRLYIHRNFCLQDMNGKTGSDHLTSLKEIKALPNPEILSEYQKWVDEQSDLEDAILGMYQVDTSPENVRLEDDEEEERMSTWVNSLTI